MQAHPIKPLILSLSVAAAPLFLKLPWWVAGWCLLLWSGVLIGHRRGWTGPSKFLLMTIFCIGMAAVVISAGLRFDGQDFMVMLAVLAGMKPLEIRNHRDHMGIVMLAYFLVITSLFVFENLTMILYLFLSVWLTTGVLIHINHTKGKIGLHLRLAARLILGAIPLMLVLFLLFPRIPGSLWGTPWSRTSYSGFSDTLRLGDASRLVLLDEPAFAVSFDTSVPATEKLYWRGIVLTHFDGQTWLPARFQPERHNGLVGESPAAYSIILEPHGRRHLFALDLPVETGAFTTIRADHTVVARWPIRQRFHYSAVSFLNYRQDANSLPNDSYLQLPLNRNPRTLELAKRLSRRYIQPQTIVDAALSFFSSEGFTYTLQPDPSGIDAVDDFLFTSRKGFCEHFATAFAVIMRAAGVPARLVGGYQGGEWNDMGRFLTVRQADAHVWCEVWLNGQGWVRVDPTFAVAPDRIDEGIETALSQTGLPGFFRRDTTHTLGRWIHSVRKTWDALNIRWNMWFMGFSSQEQLELLRHLGISSGWAGLWLMFIFIPPALVGLVILAMRLGKNTKKAAPHDAALKMYNQFLVKMSKLGMPKAPFQGPFDYARSAAEHYPDLKQDIMEITTLYVELRYGRAEGMEPTRKLRLLVQHFKQKAMYPLNHQQVSIRE